MKKLLLSFLVIFALLFTLTACGGGGSTSSDTNNETEEELEENADNTVDETTSGVEKPVSDVTDGTGLQGTWDSTGTENDITTETVLALNSNDTFEIWFGEEGDTTGVNEVAFKGTYTDDGSTLVMTPDAVTDAEDKNVGNGDFPYKLDGNTLTLTDPDGQEIVFTRSE